MAFRDTRTILTLGVYYKKALMKKWNLIQNQSPFCQMFKERPMISCKKEKHPRELLARDKIFKVNTRFHAVIVQPVTPCSFSLKIIYVSKRLEWAFSSIALYGQLASLNYFLRCPVINRETKVSFTIKALVILTALY